MSSLLSSTVLASSQANEKAEIVRRSADFHPTIWGDYFLKYTPQYLEFDPSMEQEALKLKEEVKDMLISSATTPSKNLQFIDAIQRLGFAYHFEVEIKEMLGRIMENINDLNGDINTVSLCFRLLRQEGFNISIDVLKKFTNREGRFFDDLKHDVEGILSLYEAAHLRVCGEPILEEALAFSTTHLELSVAKSSKISSFLSEKVKYALREPIHKGLPRVEARRFISVYHDDPSHDEVLLRFAKIDFNSVQRLHQKELHEVTRWWKDLDFARKLPFTRDRLVEGYIWPVGVYFEPKYSLARVILTKVIGITTLIDDIYDVYGTLEELELFTDAIERWSPSCKDQLPEYMQYCYEALLQLYDEIEEELAKEDRAYRMYYAKETMKQLVQSYFVEAQWFHNNYTPTLEEYMKIALVSSTYTMLTATSFLGMGNEVTPQVFDWLSKDPKIVRGSAVVCRLMDDVVSHKFEQDRGHVDSSVECYMKQYKVSEEEACDELKKQVVNAWKDMTEECLEPRNAPMPVLTRVLNLARVIDAVYKDGDGYTHAGGIMKRFVKSLFIENVPA